MRRLSLRLPFCKSRCGSTKALEIRERRDARLFDGTSPWRLVRSDNAVFKVLADREDAEAGLAVARQHTQLCSIGKGNTKPNRKDYIMEYWK